MHYNLEFKKFDKLFMIITWKFIWFFFNDSQDLQKDGAQVTLKHSMKPVDDTLSTDGTYEISVFEKDVLVAIDNWGFGSFRWP